MFKIGKIRKGKDLCFYYKIKVIGEALLSCCSSAAFVGQPNLYTALYRKSSSTPFFQYLILLMGDLALCLRVLGLKRLKTMLFHRVFTLEFSFLG